MDQVVAALEFPVSLPNQQRVDKMVHLLTVCGAVVSLGAGIITNNLLVLVVTFFILLLVTILVVGPLWPMYKGKNLNWLAVKF